MRRTLAIVLAFALAGLAAGCGDQSDETPTACLGEAHDYLVALDAAPGKVRLEEDTPISDCLAENQQAGDLAHVGEALVAAATQLNAEARAKPGGMLTVELGYLLGAAQRGADRTEGIHADLIRRLTVAARYSPQGVLPAGFLAAYQRGFDAGHEAG